MKLRLLGNRILATRIKRTAFPGSTIVLPQILHDDDNTGGPKEWRVLDVGPGRRNRDGDYLPVECRPGDRVICLSYTSGATDAGEGRFILDADTIIAVFPEGQPA